MSQIEIARALAMSLIDAGHEAYFAGGYVRDKMIGREAKDIDLVTSALPEQIEQVFSGYRCVFTGRSFGVIQVVVDNESFEVATYRADGAYTDGRRPDEVRFVTSLREDAARRDFTINSMFECPRTGGIIDFFGGQQDLRYGVIRCVGSPFDRINEDKLRMLRAVRFASRYGMRYDSALSEQLSKCSYWLPGVSRERISQEFQEILLHKRGLGDLKFYGLLPIVVPGIEATWGLAGEQDSVYHTEGNTWVHTQMVVDELREFAPDNFPLLLAGLLHDIGKPATQQCCGNGRVRNNGHADVGAEMAKNICSHWLKLPNEATDFVVCLVKNHMRMHHVDDMKKSTLIKLAENPHIQEMVWLQHADAVGRETNEPKFSHLEFMTRKLEEFKQLPPRQQPHSDHIITGLHILAYGIPPGQIVKTIKDAAREAQFAGEFDETTHEEWLETYMRHNYADCVNTNAPGLTQIVGAMLKLGERNKNESL